MIPEKRFVLIFILFLIAVFLVEVEISKQVSWRRTSSPARLETIFNWMSKSELLYCDLKTSVF